MLAIGHIELVLLVDHGTGEVTDLVVTLEVDELLRHASRLGSFLFLVSHPDPLLIIR